ncbi:MAG: sensor domain-containing protein, partial [Eggerthellaceae bacterium]|nr:sensor domain-containing protein [Eggerthellaceae bacterium]
MASAVEKTQGRLNRLVRQALGDSAYLFATFPIALASFIVIVTGLSLGVGLAIVWVGLPIGALTLLAGRGFARLERLRLHARGTLIAEPPSRQRSNPGNLWRRMLSKLTSASLWREALHGVLALPVSCVTWSLTLTWWVMAAAGLTGWIWEPISQRYGGSGSGATALMGLLGWPIPGALFDLIVGVIAVLTLPFVVRACAAAHVGLGRALLSQDRQSLERRVADLSEARDQLGRAESDGLRRLERDLHDGPQQSLIRLGMDLAAAERRLAEGDTASAAALLAETRSLNATIIAELRSLSRNIAPPVLQERGLKAALMAAAAMSPIPVSTQYRLTSEPNETTATTAYFVVCEALANAVKHSEATRIEVEVSLDADSRQDSPDSRRIVIKVSDDGIGGAVLLPGHGLAGLRDRVTAIDGQFSV